MENFGKEKHWQNIYKTKPLHEVSWYEPKPETSMKIIEKFDLKKTAKIIDIGGGDSLLADHLIALGFHDISVLDISEEALNRAKKRLGDNSKLVTWIVADIGTVILTEKYDLWHDRATFHFLTEKNEIDNYIQNTKACIRKNGRLILGTFSKDGPEKCSGIVIKQYCEDTLYANFELHFEKINCFTLNHETPFKTKQNFLFCSFKKVGA